jgi:hypothetical protein
MPNIPVGSSALGPQKNPTNGAAHQLVRTFPPIGNTIVPAPVGVVLQGGTIGVAYSETISTTGGVSPYTFAVTLGALPTSLTLNSTTGVISGTPTALGTFTFTIQITDHSGNFSSQAFSISIIAPPSNGPFSFGS